MIGNQGYFRDYMGGLTGVPPKHYHSDIAIEAKIEALNSIRGLKEATAVGVQILILEGVIIVFYS